MMGTVAIGTEMFIAPKIIIFILRDFRISAVLFERRYFGDFQFFFMELNWLTKEFFH